MCPDTTTPSSPSPSTTPSTLRDEDLLDVRDERMAAAYNELLPRIRAVPKGSYMQITAEIALIASTILGHERRVTALADDLERMPGMDPALPRNIGKYARAMWVADRHALIAVGSREFEQKIDRGMALRGKALACLDACVVYGHVDPAQVARIREDSGYKDLAGDLQMSLVLIRGLPADVRQRLLITDAELHEAATLANDILAGVGTRESGDHGEDVDFAAERQAAYTLCVKNWDLIRKALQYLRAEQGDAEEIAPSVFLRPSSGAKKPTTEPSTATPAPAGTAPTATPTPVPADKTPTTAPAVIPPAKGGGPFTA